MVEFDGGAWYCPRHGLLLPATTLVALYRVEGDADWSSISDLIGHTLPEAVRKVDTVEAGARTHDSAPRRP